MLSENRKKKIKETSKDKNIQQLKTKKKQVNIKQFHFKFLCNCKVGKILT